VHVRTRKLGARAAVRSAVVLAVTAATVVITASASWAVDTVTLSRTHAPSGGGGTLTISPTTAATFTTGTTGPFAVQFNFAGTCPAASGGNRPSVAPVGASGGVVNAGVVEAATVAVGALAGNDLPITIPAGLALPASVTAPTTFSVCVYDTGASNVLLAGANAGFTVDASLTSDPSGGASGGGYPITVTADSAVFDDFNSAGHTVQFQAVTATQTLCATAPMGASAPTASNATTMTGGVITVPAASVQVPTTSTMTVNVPAALAQVASPKVLSANYNICVYKTSNGLLLGETAAANQFNLSGNIALSTTSGSSNGGNSVSLTAASAIFTSGSTNVQLQTNSGSTACATHYASSNNVNVTTVRFITANKIAMTLPSGMTTTTTPYAVCVYDTTNTSTSVLVAQAYPTYTVGQVPTVTSVYPTTGPAEGGSTITVSGANFPTAAGAMTATVGGSPLINIAVAGGGASFTATVPPHVAGPAVSIAVTTAGGTSETKSLFTFTNGITVTPKTGANTRMTSTDVDITGVGFTDLTFGTTYDTNSTKAHVYLVKGAYDPTGTATKANGQVNGGECVDVLVISDKDLVCSLYLGGNFATAPTATTRNLTGCASTNSSGAVQTSATAYLGPATATSTCTFSATDVGMKLSSGTIIPDNTVTIASVSASGIATLNKATAAVVVASTAIVASSSRTVATPDAVFTTTGGATTVVSTAAPFTAGDVGKVMTGTNIAPGTYITAVNTGTASLSIAAPGAPSGTITIFTPAPIANGTYTITVVGNGGVGAQTAATYSKSIISSGSTFTVADY